MSSKTDEVVGLTSWRENFFRPNPLLFHSSPLFLIRFPWHPQLKRKINCKYKTEILYLKQVQLSSTTNTRQIFIDKR